MRFMKQFIFRNVPVIALGVILLTGCGQDKETEAGLQVQEEEKQLYSCGMHPNVIQEGPGNCPICGMKLTPLGGSPSVVTTSASVADDQGERRILYWRAPMDPTYISPKPGKSPMGMDLIPVYEGEEAFGATVKINPTVQQNMGIRATTVERRDLQQDIRTVGHLDYDESTVGHVHTKFSGWIEKTYVNITGQTVRKGQHLLDIYSPQLVSAQEEYLDALKNLEGTSDSFSGKTNKNVRSILSSTKRRLEYFDISDEQIQSLGNTGQVKKTMALISPFEGVVVEKHALDGMEVKPGMMLYTIADLSEIWVYADIYEYEAPWVRIGQEARMTLSYDPGKEYMGKVQYVYPYLEEKSRTIKVRLTFPNPHLDLKPGMYANVEIKTSPLMNVVSVPMEAVLFTGKRHLVFVELEEGRFAPRDVKIGIESGDGYYHVKDGLSEGESVVTSGQFLLDSESRLQESIAKMLQIKGSEAEQLSIEENQNEETPTEEHQHSHELEEMEEHETEKTDKHEEEHKMMKTKKTEASPSFGNLEEGMLTYYTCPMESHSYVRMSEPGNCPDCGMQLVQKTEHFDQDETYYTCPMPAHSYVIDEVPGNCPVCGMELVEAK